jgi:hypothetical protein
LAFSSPTCFDRLANGFLFKRNLTREDRIHFGMINSSLKKTKILFRPSPSL